MRRISGTRQLLLGSLLALASCRSILDIHEGQLDPTSANGGTDSGVGGTTPNGGKASPGGGNNASGSNNGGVGGTTGSGGKAGAGSQGGSQPDAGAPGDAGSDAGGAGNMTSDLFPAGFCADCIARNCAAEAQACEDEPTCVAGIPAWLACAEADAQACVTSDAGVLHQVEACAANSCDLCRHNDDGQPSVEILTPSNGAQIAVEAGGLIEVAVRVHNFSVKNLGGCGADTQCGHIHLNIAAGTTCRVSPFYNQVIFAVDANGFAESTVNIGAPACSLAVKGMTVPLSASLSASTAHQDRIPLVQSSVQVSIAP